MQNLLGWQLRMDGCCSCLPPHVQPNKKNVAVYFSPVQRHSRGHKSTEQPHGSSLSSAAHLRHCKSPAHLTARKQHLENSLPYTKNLFLHRCDKPKPHCAAQLRICGRIQSGIWVIATKKKKKKYTGKHCKKEGNYQNGFICIWNYFNTKRPANLPVLLTNHQLR